MRLGRPLATASVMAATIGASLAASPALADGSIKFADDQQNVVSPTDTAFSVSGTGCTGQDAAVGVALYAPDGTMSTIVKATPDAEGNWSAELNIPDLIKSTGVEAKTDGTADGWSIGAGCVAYGEEKGQAQEAVAFDDTKVSGSYEISTDENGAQVIKVDVEGFSPNEEVTFTLVNKADPSKTYTVGKLKADAEGNVKGNLPVPSNVPDGEYLLTIEGARYGEGGSSTKTVVVKDHRFDLVANDGNSIADNGATAAPTAPANGGSVNTPADNGATPAASTSNKPLAQTGANGLLFGGIAAALVVIGGGALIVRRRKA